MSTVPALQTDERRHYSSLYRGTDDGREDDDEQDTARHPSPQASGGTQPGLARVAALDGARSRGGAERGGRGGAAFDRAGGATPRGRTREDSARGDRSRARQVRRRNLRGERENRRSHILRAPERHPLGTRAG